MKTWAYKNLRTKTYSVMERGRVVERPEYVCLNAAKFVVRKSGHRRALEERRKNVHAYVVGDRIDNTPVSPDAIRVSYNPYVGPNFRRVSDGSIVMGAEHVWLTPNGMYVTQEVEQVGG